MYKCDLSVMINEITIYTTNWNGQPYILLLFGLEGRVENFKSKVYIANRFLNTVEKLLSMKSEFSSLCRGKTSICIMEPGDDRG